MTNQAVILIVMAGYMLMIIAIGILFARRSNKNAESYFLGGRTLGPWVSAMSAEASDMSGYLLMGVPGLAYWCGLADAGWTAIGLALGTYLNWLLVSRRLRSYSVAAGNAITVPDFLSNRFHEKKKVILGVSAIFILIFFTVYAASCFVTCGKLFAGLFNMSYHSMMLVGAAFVLLYTMLGGFLAESVSDFIQAMVMVAALLCVLIVGTRHAGGIGAVVENARAIPGYLSLTQLASPVVDASGVQQSAGAAPLFGIPESYGFLKILSTLSWGLGYFGMPQVLLRFMAIRRGEKLTRSRRIASVWVVISLTAAVAIGVMGRALLPAEVSLATQSGAENLFAQVAQLLFHPVLAGLVTAGILAATISSSDSYLLIASSAVSQNLFAGIIKKDATDKQIMRLSRLVILLITALGLVIAWDENSVIFQVVSFAWAGFGATFGPIMLFSLFWKRTTRAGAIAGMVGGGVMVFIWKLLIKPMGGLLGIYELLPAFLFSVILIAVVSLMTAPPDAEIMAEFEKAKNA